MSQARRVEMVCVAISKDRQLGTFLTRGTFSFRSVMWLYWDYKSQNR